MKISKLYNKIIKRNLYSQNWKTIKETSINLYENQYNADMKGIQLATEFKNTTVHHERDNYIDLKKMFDKYKIPKQNNKFIYKEIMDKCGYDKENGHNSTYKFLLELLHKKCTLDGYLSIANPETIDKIYDICQKSQSNKLIRIKGHIYRKHKTY